jgi:hypothetical protein
VCSAPPNAPAERHPQASFMAHNVKPYQKAAKPVAEGFM